MKRSISRKSIWEKLPLKIRAPIGLLASIIPLNIILGRKYRETMKQISAADGWSLAERRSYEIAQLSRICRLASASSYYDDLFRISGFDAKGKFSISSFHNLPFLDKQTVNGHAEDMAVRDLADKSVDYVTTGGTSGVPLRFYIGRERSSIEYAHLMSAWGRVGFRTGDVKAVLRGRVIKEKSRDGVYTEYDPLLREHYFSNFHMSPDQMAKYVKRVSRLGRCFLHVYPSSIYMLARFIKSAGMSAPKNIVAILTESENVYSDQRKFVEDVFGCRYFSSYGHSEKLVCAAECEESFDYHVYPTYGYFELVDSDGVRITEPGRSGEIVGTGYINNVVPFIRYKTGDFAEYVGSSCDKCNRNFETIRDIRGHNVQEFLIAKGGNQIPWSAINMHDDTFDNVRQYQFRQEEVGKAKALLVVNSGYSQEDGKSIIKRMREKLGDSISIEIEIVDSIGLTERGKAVFVDQRIEFE